MELLSSSDIYCSSIVSSYVLIETQRTLRSSNTVMETNCSKNNHGILFFCIQVGLMFSIFLICWNLLTERFFNAYEAIAGISNIDIERFLHILDSIWLNTLNGYWKISVCSPWSSRMLWLCISHYHLAFDSSLLYLDLDKIKLEIHLFR